MNIATASCTAAVRPASACACWTSVRPVRREGGLSRLGVQVQATSDQLVPTNGRFLPELAMESTSQKFCDDDAPYCDPPPAVPPCWTALRLAAAEDRAPPRPLATEQLACVCVAVAVPVRDREREGRTSCRLLPRIDVVPVFVVVVLMPRPIVEACTVDGARVVDAAVVVGATDGGAGARAGS